MSPPPSVSVPASSLALPQARSEMEARLYVAERILKVFLPERVGYLFVSLLSCLTLFAVIWSLFNSGRAQAMELTLMFGSTGLITISSARVLKMFHDVMRAVVQNAPVESGEDER